MPLVRGYGGKISAQDELPIHALGDDYAVEGSGTVNRLPSMPCGIMVHLRMISAPTFKNSTRLICQSGIDYVATPGDLAIARSDGDGVWRLYVLRSSAPVTAINGQVGAILSYFPPQGRLTLTSGVPVMTSTAAGQTTVYYTPAAGDLIPLYDGTNFVPAVFTELSQLTTDTTKSPAAVTTNSNYDVFVWNDSGTLRATRGPAWSSSTARGTGAGTTELVRVKGLYFNSNSITNGPAAQRGTYVGTIRSNGTSTIDWILGAAGAGGTAAVLGVWNAYNREIVSTTVTDSNGSWAYTSATVRQVDGSAGNQVSFISGLAADGISASYSGGGSLAAVAGAFYQIGFALDSVTVFDKNNVFQTGAAAGVTGGSLVINSYGPQLGYHYIAALERSDGTNATTFVGGTRSGLTVQVMA
jgi:hypothetical protein